jgi:Protein of unknown function (DUF3987)
MALTSPSLPLSWQAKRTWTEFFNDVESELSRSGALGDVADIGSKIAQNASRMAGFFHVIEHDPVGEIGPQLMAGATAVVSWRLNEARRVIGASRKPEDVADADLLLEWLFKQEAEQIDPRDILRRGPRRLRDSARRDRALKVLVDRHWVSERRSVSPDPQPKSERPDMTAAVLSAYRQSGKGGDISDKSKDPGLFKWLDVTTIT